MLVLSIFVVIVGILLGKNPDDFLSKYSSLFLVLVLTIAFGLFYLITARRRDFIDFKFNMYKLLIALFWYMVLYLLIYNFTPKLNGFVMTAFSAVINIIFYALLVYLFLNFMLYFYTSNKEVAGPHTSSFKKTERSESQIDSIFRYAGILFVVISYCLLCGVGGYYLYTYFLESLLSGEGKHDTVENTQFTQSGSIIGVVLLVIALSVTTYYVIVKLRAFSKSFRYSDISEQATPMMPYLMAVFAMGYFCFMITMIVLASTKINATGSNPVQYAIYVFLIIFVMSLIYRGFSKTYFYRSSPFVQLVLDSALYIPCLVIAGIDNIVKFFVRFDSPSTTDFVLLGIVLVLNIVYFSYPKVAQKVSEQGGNVLLRGALPLSSYLNLADYATLNYGAPLLVPNESGDGSPTAIPYNYNYAVSFWFYINAVGPSSSASASVFTPIFSFGGKPAVMYRAKDNTLIVSLDLTGQGADTGNTHTIKVFNGKTVTSVKTTILYGAQSVLLQKWNNIILNCAGGTLDVFLNGTLVNSSSNHVPFLRNDQLSIGCTNGVSGKICNVEYFSQTLTAYEIFYLYNVVKDYDPPLIQNDKSAIPSQVTKGFEINGVGQ